jgi:adenosylcobinamide-GDP ribazoletransferase
VHLDGLADSADALGAGSNRGRALEIMRDSRIGSFGAVALFFVLALKVVALGGASGAARYAAIYLAPGLARWAMVATAYRVDYLRAEGAGGTLLGRGDPHSLIIASMTVVVSVLPVIGLGALGACIVAIALAWVLRALCLRWLGGVTGDLIGAAGEIVETAVILAVTL